MSATRVFVAKPASIAEARRHVIRALPKLPEEAAEIVALLTSELATNAVKYGGPDFTVTAEQLQGRIRVEVADRSDREPVVRSPSPVELSGRGLRIVAELADDWGAAPRDRGGKVVWFEIALPYSVDGWSSVSS